MKKLLSLLLLGVVLSVAVLLFTNNEFSTPVKEYYASLFSLADTSELQPHRATSYDALSEEKSTKQKYL